MRPLKPTGRSEGRSEPSLTRASQPERAYPDEPVLRRSDRPAAPTYTPLTLRADELREPAKAFARLEPSLRSAAAPAGHDAPAEQVRQDRSHGRLFSAPPPVLADPAAKAISAEAPYAAPRAWENAPNAARHFGAHEAAEGARTAAPAADPIEDAAAPRKRMGIPLRWLETRAETRARKSREEQDAADLAADRAEQDEAAFAAHALAAPESRTAPMAAWSSAPALSAAPLRFGAPEHQDGRNALRAEPQPEFRADAGPPARRDLRAEQSLLAEDDLGQATRAQSQSAAPAAQDLRAHRSEPGLAAKSHAAALAWVGAAQRPAPPRDAPSSVIASAQMQAPSLAPYQPSSYRAQSAAKAAEDVWTPVLPGHAPLRAEPSAFRIPDLAPSRAGRPIAVFGAVSEPAASGSWPKDPGLNAAVIEKPALDDDDDVPYRPWLSLGRQADGRQVAVPGTSGSGILLARPGQQAAGVNSSLSGPWQAAQSSEADTQDEPGWDRFYVESDTSLPSSSVRAPSFAAFYADDDDEVPQRSSRSAPAAAYTVTPAYTESAQASAVPNLDQPLAAKGFAAEADVPEAPMIEARGTRRDPAPSRTAYRLQRMWLTPLYRALLRKGVPAFVLVFACGLALKDEARREALVTWAGDLRATITERPEFMVAELKIDGASPETEQALRAVLNVQFPVSSFDLELPVLQAKASEVAAVASAALHVRSGGVLEVLVEERKPVVVWRSETGIGTLDPTGHQVASLQNRLERPDLPLIVGLGAETAVPEALRLYHAAGPIRDRVRGLIRVGDRRWDLIVDPAIRVMLPAKDPVPALEQVVALHDAQALLDRDITAVDLRNPARATVRMGAPAAETWRLNLAAQKGKVSQ